jgi:hypothetical protein
VGLEVHYRARRHQRVHRRGHGLWGSCLSPVATATTDEIEPRQLATPVAAELHTPWASADADGVEFAKPTTVPASELFDAAYDTDAPHRYHRIAYLLGPDARGAGPVERLFLTSVEERASVAEAEQDPCWRKAMLEEMTSMEPP